MIETKNETIKLKEKILDVMQSFENVELKHFSSSQKFSVLMVAVEEILLGLLETGAANQAHLEKGADILCRQIKEAVASSSFLAPN